MGLPESIWANFIIPFLSIRAAVLLRLLNKYSLCQFPRLLDLYSAHCTQQLFTLPDLSAIQAEFQRLSTEAFQYLTTNLTRSDIPLIRSLNVPPPKLRALLEVWIMLLTGTKPTDPVNAFRRHSYEFDRLKDLKKVPDRKLMLGFLESYTEEELRLILPTCAVFYKYVERMAQAEELHTAEFQEIERQAEYWQQEATMCTQAALPH